MGAAAIQTPKIKRKSTDKSRSNDRTDKRKTCSLNTKQLCPYRSKTATLDKSRYPRSKERHRNQETGFLHIQFQGSGDNQRRSNNSYKNSSRCCNAANNASLRRTVFNTVYQVCFHQFLVYCPFQCQCRDDIKTIASTKIITQLNFPGPHSTNLSITFYTVQIHPKLGLGKKNSLPISSLLTPPVSKAGKSEQVIAEIHIPGSVS